MSTRFGRLRAISEACDEPAVGEVREALAGHDEATITLGTAVAGAYPALRALVVRRTDALAAIAREGYKNPR